jgi:hypothetical protein
VLLVVFLLLLLLFCRRLLLLLLPLLLLSLLHLLQSLVLDGHPVNAPAFANCKCDGTDRCESVVYADQASRTPFTVNFHDVGCCAVSHSNDMLF